MVPTVRLGDFVTEVCYGTSQASNPNGWGYPTLRIPNVLGGRTDLTDLTSVDAHLRDVNRYQLKRADLLLVRTNGNPDYVGRSTTFEPPDERTWLFASYLIRVRLDERMNSKFVDYFLKSQAGRQSLLRRVTTSAGNNNINTKSVLSLPVPWFEPPEQQAIVRILDAADKAIEWTRKAIATAERLRKGLVQDGLRRCRKVKAPVERLDKVAEIGSGVTLGRDLSGSATVDLPYLRVANVQDGFLDLSEIKTVKVRTTEVEQFSLAAGDVLLTEGGDIDKLGRGAVWDGSIAPCLHQNHIFRVRADRSRLEPEFLATLIGSEHGKRYFLRIAKRTTNLASINKTQLSAFPVLLPDLRGQRRIVERLAATQKLLDVQQKELRQFERLKRGLMQDLLTGRVRVKV